MVVCFSSLWGDEGFMKGEEGNYGILKFNPISFNF